METWEFLALTELVKTALRARETETRGQYIDRTHKPEMTFEIKIENMRQLKGHC